MARMTRVKNLERRFGGQWCPQCGGDDPNRTFDVELSFDQPGDTPPQYCDACGRQLTYVVEWGSDDDTPPAA